VTHAFSVETRPVVEARLSTTVISPNGDGQNDTAEILLILSQFTSGIEVEVEILDLSGRRVRRLIFDQRAAGAYDEAWDGRDDDGHLVPPGLYVLRVSAASDAETFHSSNTVGVVY
jgi:flagellar hook assembly protein FlgD